MGNDATKDLFWFVLIILFMGFIWISTGGYKRDSAKDPFIKPPAPLNTGETYGEDPFPKDPNKKAPANIVEISIGNSSANDPFGRGASSQGTTGTINQTTSGGLSVTGQSPTTGTTVKPTTQKPVTTATTPATQPKTPDLGKYSKYKGKLAIQSVSTSNSSTPGKVTEYVTLQTIGTIAEAIPLSGMVLKSTVTNQQATIGNGAVIPFPNLVNYQAPILLGTGDRVYVSTGRSPIGTSFRSNKCAGYFFKSQVFTPSAYTSCPRLTNETMPKAPNALNDACLDYIQNISSCSTITNIPMTYSHECQAFVIERANYSWCVDNHRTDKDFAVAEWRVYLDRSARLWKDKREVIQLIDQDGKIVDETTY